MGCKQSREETVVRSGSGRVFNRQVHKQRKFRSGLHVEKTNEMGAEANFQAAYTTDVEEKYSKVNEIPRVLDLVNTETQTDVAKKVHLNNE